MIKLKERWRHLNAGIYNLSDESEQIAIDCGKAVKIVEPTEESTVDEIKRWLDAHEIKYKSSENKSELLEKA